MQKHSKNNGSQKPFMFLFFTCLLSANLACGQGHNYGDFSRSISQIAVQNSLDDHEALEAQANRAIKQEITVTAKVIKLLKEDTIGLPHQKFLILLSNGTTILIAHDLKMAPAVPVKPGDILTIHGEYIWNSRGGLIHWTHHSDTPRHQSGWIEFKGNKYD